ncbi:hypothetical protein [Parafrankia sp. FMc2]|uniref:hypothetical protein n=1 Tax=Parafrankia sp. FMc2 TaxID=3233196 RepID=UPI0034D53A7F
MICLRLRELLYIAFYSLNGRRLTLTNDEAHDLVVSIASGVRGSGEDIIKSRCAGSWWTSTAWA